MTANLELWSSEEREFRSINIGAASGSHHIGTFRGPGLYFLVHENAGAKTSHLNLLLHAQDEGYLRRSANISLGKTEALFELEPLRITFNRAPSGAVTAEAEGLGEGPRVVAMPDAIETLISGDDLIDDEARARRRLGALLSYAPVDSDDERLRVLLEAFRDRPWSEEIDRDIARAYDELIAEAKSQFRGLRVEPLRTLEEIEDWVAENPKRKGSILDDQDLLIQIANATGNAVEKAADVQRRRIAKIEGRRDEAVAQASKIAGHDEVPEAYAAEHLEGEVDIEALREEHREARDRRVDVRSRYEERLAAERRQERLRKSHGDRPDLSDAEADVSRREEDLEMARLTCEGARAEHARAVREVESIGEATDRAQSEAVAAVVDWAEFSRDLTLRVMPEGVEADAVRYGLDLEAEAGRARSLVKRIADAVRVDLSDSWERARTVAAARAEALDQAEAAVRRAESELEAARDRLRRQESELESWERTQAEIEEPIEGPDAEEVKAAEEAEAMLAKAVDHGRAALHYQAVASQLAAALDLARRLDEVASGYRDAAKDTWYFLGQIVTDELRLPWLQVDGLDIYLGYRDGRLNADPELIAEARAAAEQAAAARDQLSQVALQRFIFNEIREVSDVDWRDIDDDTWLSTAELHEACLEVMLSRRSKLGGLLIVPWRVIGALDADRLRRFDRRVRDAGLTMVSERPRRDGDPREMVLERVADTEPSPPVDEAPEDAAADDEGEVAA